MIEIKFVNVEVNIPCGVVTIHALMSATWDSGEPWIGLAPGWRDIDLVRVEGFVRGGQYYDCSSSILRSLGLWLSRHWDAVVKATVAELEGAEGARALGPLYTRREV